MLHQQILFPQNGKLFNDLYYFERVENIKKEKDKKSSYFLHFYIYSYFNFHEVENILPMVLFPRRGK